jgi:hypothetical protein
VSLVVLKIRFNYISVCLVVLEYDIRNNIIMNQLTLNHIYDAFIYEIDEKTKKGYVTNVFIMTFDSFMLDC